MSVLMMRILMIPAIISCLVSIVYLVSSLKLTKRGEHSRALRNRRIGLLALGISATIFFITMDTFSS
jgi:hypothetical protein